MKQAGEGVPVVVIKGFRFKESEIGVKEVRIPLRVIRRGSS